MQFSRLLGSQIVGAYINQGYNGSLKITSGQDFCTIWFHDGTVTSLRTTKLSEAGAIPFLLSIDSGILEIKAEFLTTARLNYCQELENHVLTTKADFSSTLTFAQYMYCAQTKLNPDPNLKTIENIKKLRQACQNGLDFQTLQRSMIEKDFWPAFIIASSCGLLSISFHQLLGALVKRYQEAMESEIKRFMGVAIAQSFTHKIDQSIVEWRNHFSDTSYGTQPFEAWAKAIRIACNEVVPSNISEKMQMKVMGTLPENDKKTIELLGS